jgi:BirA family transcriptional regulator, biotin operon repressor / biotin---[acetyl-CoA-carboxylase] ligase
MDLATEPRVVRLLESSPTWHTLWHLAEVGSTQDEALTRLREGVPAGAVVVADAQRTGRGRLGRPWRDDVRGASGPANLAVTATAPAPESGVGLVPLVAGMSVAWAYDAAGAHPRLKWPNDVLLDGKKAAGILVERHEVVGKPVLLIGCGLNLDWRGVPRDEESANWTSLAEVTGQDVDRAQVLVDLLAALAVRLGHLNREPASVLDAYRPLCATLGERVRVERPGCDPLVGEAIDLDDDGRLVVRTATDLVTIDAGDITHLRPATDHDDPLTSK